MALQKRACHKLSAPGRPSAQSQTAVTGEGMPATYQADARLPCPSSVTLNSRLPSSCPSAQFRWSSCSGPPQPVAEDNCRVFNPSEGILHLARQLPEEGTQVTHPSRRALSVHFRGRLLVVTLSSSVVGYIRK